MPIKLIYGHFILSQIRRWSYSFSENAKTDLSGFKNLTGLVLTNGD